MRQVMKIKRLSVETEEKSPMMPIAIMPWRISGGRGSSEELVKPVVASIVDLIIGMELNMSKFGGTRANLSHSYVFSHTSGLEQILAEAFCPNVEPHVPKLQAVRDSPALPTSGLT
jgi:hypothetical protein